MQPSMRVEGQKYWPHALQILVMMEKAAEMV